VRLAKARRAGVVGLLFYLVPACSLPGTSPHSPAAKEDGGSDGPSDASGFAPAFAPDGAADDASVADDGPPLVPGSPVIPLRCGSSEPTCCGVFDFEDGSIQGFSAPACCAEAFSRVDNVSLTSQAAEGGCGTRALRVAADFQSPPSPLCVSSPFDVSCQSQIGEISAMLPDTFDLRGMRVVGRIWLPDDIVASTFSPRVRAFVVGPTGLVYGAPSVVPGSGWQSFVSTFPEPAATTLATVGRLGFQVALLTSGVPGNRWTGPIWFDAFAWEPAP